MASGVSFAYGNRPASPDGTPALSVRRMAEAEACPPSSPLSWYPCPRRRMVNGISGLFWRRMALQYSIPRRLLGEPRSLSISSLFRGKSLSLSAILSRAWLRAWGQLRPLRSPMLRSEEKSSPSCARIPAAVRILRISPSSLPKHRTSTAPSPVSRATPQAAKSSALLTAKAEGSSTTRSAPQERAILVRRYLL